MVSAAVASALGRGHGQARKLRVLCLHGMYQNGAVFATKTQHLRRNQCELVEFVYLDGPFTVVPKIITQRQPKPTDDRKPRREQHRVRCTKNHDEFRAWWRPASGSQHVSSTQLDDDREILIAFLHAKLAEVGDIDGVMGFSQGASLASWMCSTQARAELRWSPRLAILIGSYVGPKQYCMKSGIVDDVSSLHMYGSNDHVISAAKSHTVVDIFRDAQVETDQVVTSIHNQGHVIPKSEDVLNVFDDFLHGQHDHLILTPSAQASARRAAASHSVFLPTSPFG